MKKFMAVLFVLMVTAYFAAPVMAAEPASAPIPAKEEVKTAHEESKDAKEEKDEAPLIKRNIRTEMTGKFVLEGKYYNFVNDMGETFFVNNKKDKKFVEISKITDFTKKNFNLTGKVKDARKKGQKRFLRIEEFKVAGATEVVPAQKVKKEEPKVEEPKKEEPKKEETK